MPVNNSALISKLSDEECLAQVQADLDKLPFVENFARVAQKVRAVSANSTTLVCELVVSSEHLNRGGTLHGGFSATLVDIITSRAIGISVGMSKPRATIDLSASYLLPVKAGEKITMTATVLQVGHSTAFAEVVFRKEDGKIAVTGKQTMAIF
ncbi:hypothetical protein PMAYCL1PPCAC_11416 [Pristionchus mayeri]|uniref:Thioesterase domain-containing protein n=1 Tax=Pristionchus mayeri TaxID=1317129 RepID=A0AAN4ZI41_9BILA|nr:hypothetical protein PMAYCL1PPCAC_11416 [Pristionchus mayeri]